MKFPKYLVFDRNQYSSDTDFWDDVSTMIQILIRNEYVVSFRYEDCSFYRLEYEYDDEEIAEFKTNWLEMEEYEKFLDWKYSQENVDKNA